MDQSRPGHQALPLIIERPDLAHPYRIAFSYFLTACGWMLWLAMWLPFISALGRYLGYRLPVVDFPSQLSLNSFLILIRFLPYVIGGAVLLIACSYIWEKIKSHSGFPDRRWRPIGLERLALSADLDPQRLAKWQSARVLYVHHGDHGNVIDAQADQPKRPD